MSRYGKPLATRIMLNVDVNENGCLVWNKSVSHNGYGLMNVGGKNARVHRVAFELAFGDIPEGKQVCHSCDNPPCCNPNHLFLGTAKQNAEDRDSKGRGGKRTNGYKLTVEDVLLIRKSQKTVKELAATFDVSVSTVYAIVNGSRWGSLNEQGEYNVGK